MCSSSLDGNYDAEGVVRFSGNYDADASIDTRVACSCPTCNPAPRFSVPLGDADDSFDGQATCTAANSPDPPPPPSPPPKPPLNVMDVFEEAIMDTFEDPSSWFDFSSGGGGTSFLLGTSAMLPVLLSFVVVRRAIPTRRAQAPPLPLPYYVPVCSSACIPGGRWPNSPCDARSTRGR